MNLSVYYQADIIPVMNWKSLKCEISYKPSLFSISTDELRQKSSTHQQLTLLLTNSDLLCPLFSKSWTKAFTLHWFQFQLAIRSSLFVDIPSLSNSQHDLVFICFLAVSQGQFNKLILTRLLIFKVFTIHFLFTILQGKHQRVRLHVWLKSNNFPFIFFK